MRPASPIVVATIKAPSSEAAILRSSFRDQYRRRQREVADIDGHYAGTLDSQPDQSKLTSETSSPPIIAQSSQFKQDRPILFVQR
jgi:hypothetical protein